MTYLGTATLVAAFVLVLYSGSAALFGARSGDRRWVDSSRRGIYAVAGLLTLAVVNIETAFARNDFSFELVQGHSSTTTPSFYELTAATERFAQALAAIKVAQHRLGDHAQGETVLGPFQLLATIRQVLEHVLQPDQIVFVLAHVIPFWSEFSRCSKLSEPPG